MKITYDVEYDGSLVPVAGEYLVSMVKRGVGSIYHIISVKKVNSNVWPHRFSLEVERAFAHVTVDEETGLPYVNFQRAHPLYWYNRTNHAKSRDHFTNR